MQVNLDLDDRGEVSRITKLGDYLFGTPDRILASISVLTGILSIILTLVLWKFPETVPQLIIIRDITVLIILFLATIFFLFKYYREASFREQTISKTKEEISNLETKFKEEISNLETHLKKTNLTLTNQLRYSYDIVHNFRNEIFGHFQEIIPENLEVEVTREQFAVFRNICFFITAEIRKSFVQYFKFKHIDIEDDIAITVKLLVPSGKVAKFLKNHLSDVRKEEALRKKQWIITVFRDPHTYETYREKREVGSKLYDVENNTAFLQIIVGGAPYFYSNDLKKKDGYRNENVNWKNYYNSTLVVPIRYRSENLNRHFCFGLLAVDSLNEKGLELYDPLECRLILSHAADLLANFFLAIAVFQFSSPNERKDGEV